MQGIYARIQRTPAGSYFEFPWPCVCDLSSVTNNLVVIRYFLNDFTKVKQKNHINNKNELFLNRELYIFHCKSQNQTTTFTYPYIYFCITPLQYSKYIRPFISIIPLSYWFTYTYLMQNHYYNDLERKIFTNRLYKIKPSIPQIRLKYWFSHYYPK